MSTLEFDSLDFKVKFKRINVKWKDMVMVSVKCDSTGELMVTDVKFDERLRLANKKAKELIKVSLESFCEFMVTNEK